MKLSWRDKARGAVTVRIGKGAVERLVNEAAADGLRLLSLRRTSGGEWECEVTLRDFFRLRPHLKRTGCRTRVLRRHGLPFALARLERRKFFAAGMALFIVGMYMLSSLVWTVEVTGNEKLSDEQVLQAARQEGVYPFQWSFRLQDLGVLSKRLTTVLPDAAWVGVKKTGTKITIQVVESTVPEPKPLLSPRHLVAKHDAVVTRVMAEQGRPVVERNARVKRGDILISGTLGGENASRTVVAKGDVRGLVWHEYSIVSPLTRTARVYTGERKTAWYAVIGGRALQLSGFGKPPFDTREVVREQEQFVWRGIALPFGRIKQTTLEARIETRPVGEEEARAEGLLQARADILSKAGDDAVIRAQKLLHETSENGKVYMKVLFEVEQSITAEMPLVYQQGE